MSKVIENQFQPLQKFKKPILQNWIRANGFLVGLVGVVVLAFFFPDPGARNGWLHAESVSDWGLAVIMLLQGLSMPLEKARQGAGNWRLHILIQGFTFIIFPIVGLVLQLVLPIIWPTEPAAIQKGFLYLCVLPSTVSTSVVYTSVARGNTAAAVFSAAFSNLLGVFLTPALVGVLMQMSGGTGSFGLLFLQIILLTLVPFVIGMALRPLVHRLVDENKKWVNRVSNALILFIVYSAFCESVKSHVWEKYGLTLTVEVLAVVIFLFTVISLQAHAASRWAGLDIPDRIAVYFCSVKKTLAMGVPLAMLIFGGSSDLSLILLPIMFYHPLQLLVNGLLANRWAAR